MYIKGFHLGHQNLVQPRSQGFFSTSLGKRISRLVASASLKALSFVHQSQQALLISIVKGTGNILRRFCTAFSKEKKKNCLLYALFLTNFWYIKRKQIKVNLARLRIDWLKAFTASSATLNSLSLPMAFDMTVAKRTQDF